MSDTIVPEHTPSPPSPPLQQVPLPWHDHQHQLPHTSWQDGWFPEDTEGQHIYPPEVLQAYPPEVLYQLDQTARQTQEAYFDPMSILPPQFPQFTYAPDPGQQSHHAGPYPQPGALPDMSYNPY